MIINYAKSSVLISIFVHALYIADYYLFGPICSSWLGVYYQYLHTTVFLLKGHQLSEVLMYTKYIFNLYVNFDSGSILTHIPMLRIIHARKASI